MEMTRLENVLQQRTHLPDEVSSWEGPALDLLLARAEIKLGPMLLTVEGADGYMVKREREDLRSAIVALKDGDGRWLAEVGDRRPLRLVPPHTTGNYWVSNVTRITVEPVPNSLLGPK
jgi:DMSO/TMAO reductase YedYZ molybdopterin-dependent catalytic subunit